MKEVQKAVATLSFVAVRPLQTQKWYQDKFAASLGAIGGVEASVADCLIVWDDTVKAPVRRGKKLGERFITHWIRNHIALSTNYVREVQFMVVTIDRNEATQYPVRVTGAA